MDKKSKRMPVLPIPNVVFFPRTALPLYVEETSYVRMIRDVVEQDGEIAVALARPMWSTEPSGELGKVHYSPSEICGAGRPVILEELDCGA